MAKVTFYPLGNADSTLIDTRDGKKILFDFGDQKNRDDKTDKRIALAETLREDLEQAERDYYDIFAVTHLDLDHVQGSSEFFWLEHAKKYQGDGRIQIRELWVPAAVICEDRPDEDDARVIQREARHRFKEGKGIRVFSEPSMLADWCKRNGISLDERKRLITNAGEVVPGVTLSDDGIEFFAHCPFAHRCDEAEEIDRNDDALVVQATFVEQGVETRLILGSDVTWEVWVEIVALTRKYKNDDRLKWDVFKLPHHCSYLSLAKDKGEDKTVPHNRIKWMYETQGQPHGIIVSPSKPIPAEDTDQPPHRQAANYHRDTTRGRPGEFKVTMEHPTISSPEPIVISIDKFGATVRKKQRSGAAAITAVNAPRAG